MATVTDRTAFERWEKENAAAPVRPQPPTTVSNVPIDALYTPESLGDFDPDSDLGFPGQYPYARVLHLFTDKEKEAPAAHDFIQFVQSSTGQKLLTQMGFRPRS